MTHLINDHYHVELLEGAELYRIHKLKTSWLLIEGAAFAPIPLPDGRWEIAFTRDTQTEEGWKGVVDKKETIYKGDWFVDYKDEFDCIKPAAASGHSLLESKGIDHKLNFVIIKKI